MGLLPWYGLIEFLGSVLGVGLCAMWTVLIVGALAVGFRRAPFLGWLWDLPPLAALDERIGGWRSRIFGRRAVELAMRMRTQNLRDSKARYNLGVLYMEQRRWPLAIEELRASIDINPDRSDAQLRMGRCYTELKRFAEAREAFRECLALRSDHSECQLLLARLLLAHETPDEAEPVWAAYVDGHRDDVEGWAMLGLCRTRLGRSEEAKECFRNAVQRSRFPSPGNRARYRRAVKLAGEELHKLGG